MFFFFKQKTAYEMRISDWSSDVCSSDLLRSFQPSCAKLKHVWDSIGINCSNWQMKGSWDAEGAGCFARKSFCRVSGGCPRPYCRDDRRGFLILPIGRWGRGPDGKRVA